MPDDDRAITRSHQGPLTPNPTVTPMLRMTLSSVTPPVVRLRLRLRLAGIGTSALLTLAVRFGSTSGRGPLARAASWIIGSGERR